MQEELENVEETQQVEETPQAEETTDVVDESKFQSAGDDSVIKIDLNKPVEEPVEEAVEEQEVEVVAEETTEEVVEAEAPVIEEVIEEITDEKIEEVEEQIEEAVAEAEATGKPLPENIQKLVDFMEETGGDINDYARLNQDYSQMSNNQALEEYYKLTKPHLDAEERAFLMDENFSFDEDVDDERDIRKKKIALKEQVAEAKAYLDGQKSKYYEEIKAGSKLTSEQQKAVDFFNRYNKESEANESRIKNEQSTFLKKTESVFNDKFKGFEYNVGDKKYRFNVKNAGEVKDTQGDINNFVKKFLNKDNEMSDAKGYHKSLFTAMNPDAVANHFYEQGKADAMKDSVAKAKNVSMDPRQSFSNDNTSGPKVRVLNDDSPNFKFKIKNKNK